MKKTLIFALTILFIGLFISVFPTEKEGDIYTDTVRLHILARSDSTYDQIVKLKIRDKIISEYGKELSTLDSASEARVRLDELLPKLKNDVDLWLNELGCESKCTVTLTEEWYETREYEDFSLPRGIYTSLKIEIDEGKGQNWWCVMFPPLCLDIATEDAPKDDVSFGYSEEEIALVDKTKKYNVKFKVLEIISDIFA